MTQRIRYFNSAFDGKITRPIKTQEQNVVVVLQPQFRKATIFPANHVVTRSETPIEIVESKSVVILKQKVKLALKKLGAKFSDEIRQLKGHEQIGLTNEIK